MSGKKQPRNGKLASKVSKPRLGTKPRTPNVKLEKLLAAIYDQFQKLDDPTTNKQCKRDFVFHMTDWSEDLQRLAELYRQPEKFDQKSVGQLVAGFLYHVIPHLREAGWLMLDYDPENVFESPKPKV